MYLPAVCVRVEKLLEVIADLQQPGSELSHSYLLYEDSQLASGTILLPTASSSSSDTTTNPDTLIRCVCVGGGGCSW